MKNLLSLLFLTASINVIAQVEIPMTLSQGVYTMPCKVNGLKLNFIFDTGASGVSISSTEALFMIKNGYIHETDFGDPVNLQIANGDVIDGMIITLKEVKIGETTLSNVEATVVNSLTAPLLMGQSVLNRLGIIEFNYKTQTLTYRSTNHTFSYVSDLYIDNLIDKAFDAQDSIEILKAENRRLQMELEEVKSKLKNQ